MIDTLKVYIEDFTVTPGSEIIIQPSPYVLGSGELTSDHPLIESEGVSVGGSKAYLNTERFNLTIQDKSKAFLQCSLPKVIAGNNYQPLNKKEAEQAINSVGRELWKAGFHTEIDKSSISRIDTFRNVLTEEPYPQYADLFRVLRGKRKLKRDYGSTFLWHNTQEQLTIYDKIAEMKIRKVDTRNYPKNTMRFEHRLLNKRKAAKVLGFSAAGEIVDNWEVIKDNTRQSWERDLFSFTVGDIEVMACEEIEELYRYAKRTSKRYLNKFIQLLAGSYLSLVKPETLREMIYKCESEEASVTQRVKVHRALKKFSELEREVALILPNRSGKRLSDYYTELKSKVLKHD